MRERIGVALLVAGIGAPRALRYSAGIVALALALAALFAAASWAASGRPAGPSACWGEPTALQVQACFARTPRCEEDEPCWDCRTMGNGHCGNNVDRRKAGNG